MNASHWKLVRVRGVHSPPPLAPLNRHLNPLSSSPCRFFTSRLQTTSTVFITAMLERTTLGRTDTVTFQRVGLLERVGQYSESVLRNYDSEPCVHLT